jgi:hypothetical protein
MSEMTHAMTKAETELLILQSEKGMGMVLDEKLGQLKESVDARFTKQDDKLDAIIASVADIKKQGIDWHKTDLEYRASVQREMSKMQALLDTIKGWIRAFRLLSAVRSGAVTVVKEGKQYLIAIAAVCGAFAAVVQFFHVVLPWLHKVMR